MEMSDELERATDPDGKELVLRREQGGFVVLREGQVALASAARRSERELVNLALGPLRDRNDIAVLLGGLGMGYALRALLDDPRVVRVDVVEHCPPLVEWNRTHLSVLHDRSPLLDQRVHLHQMDFDGFLRAMRYGTAPQPPLPEGGGYLAIVLDLDDGPGQLSRVLNRRLYQDEGLMDIEEALRPGGVLALWSPSREIDLLQRIRGRFQNVAEIAVPVEVPGGGLDYIYRCRRSAPPAAEGSHNGHGNGHVRS